jgi:hypothetical protein
VQRQRPALLLANGNIYAAFGSFGDLAEDVSRGWLLGWYASSLAPLPANELTNQQPSSKGDCWHHGSGPCFLTSIWMSGFGPAADQNGNVFFVTANSDAGSYSPPINIPESAVMMSGDLTQLLDYFTPVQAARWDEKDTDFGSGGMTLIPAQPGPIPNLAVAAGKSGTMYLLDRDNMGKRASKPTDTAAGEVAVGGCWCGASYFQGSDGIGRVVSSGGNKVEVWKIVTSSKASLLQQAVSASLPSGQDPGFLTSVSSNGTAAGSAIVWAVTRPESINGSVTLFAIDPADGSTLFSAAIGIWPRGDQNANLVPIVANGRVYVAVDSNLYAFGLGGGNVTRVTAANSEPRVDSNEVHGTILRMHGTEFVVRTRSGAELAVDGSDAANAHRSAPVFVGNAIAADGYYDNGHVFHARLIYRAKDSPALWAADK